MNTLNSMATNTLVSSLSPEQRVMLLTAVTEAAPEGGPLRTLWRAVFAPREWWRVGLYLIGASWLARQVLLYGSERARTVVQWLLRHVIRPVIQVPLRLLGLPTLAGEIVESFLADSIEARKSQETASMHMLPLVIAASNLHRRLRQILDHGHAYDEAEDPKRHSKAKHELLFLFGEYLAWQEELRRFVHRRSNYSWHMREAQVVADAFSEPLESDRDPILQNISVGGEPELSSTADVSKTHQQDSLCSGPSTAWNRVKDFLRLATQFLGRTPGGSNVRDRQRGNEWVELWLAGTDPHLGPLPIVYRSSTEAVNRQHDTNAGVEIVKQLERNDVVHIWRGPRGPLCADGAAMRFVRDTDRLQREADGALVCDSGIPLELDPDTGLHKPAPVFWLAAGKPAASTGGGELCQSRSRPGAEVAGTIAAAVGIDDDVEQASSSFSDSCKAEHSNGSTSASASGHEGLRPIGRTPGPSGSPSSANMSRDEVSLDKTSGCASVVAEAEQTEQAERRHQLATDAEHGNDSVGVLAPMVPSQEDANTSMQTDSCVADCASSKAKNVKDFNVEDYRVSVLELRLMGEVMLRNINPQTNDPNTQGFKGARWGQHFQANVLSYSEFVHSFSEGLESSTAGSTPFARAFLGVAELYDRLSTCHTGTLPVSQILTQMKSPTTPEIIRRVRTVERALLKQIVSLDSRGEWYPEGHLYAKQSLLCQSTPTIDNIKQLLAQVMPGAVPSPQ